MILVILMSFKRTIELAIFPNKNYIGFKSESWIITPKKIVSTCIYLRLKRVDKGIPHDQVPVKNYSGRLWSTLFCKSKIVMKNNIKLIF